MSTHWYHVYMQNHPETDLDEGASKQRPIRIPEGLWQAHGRVVGERDRSADIKAFIRWRLRHPLIKLDDAPNEQTLDFFVRIRVTTDLDGTKRRAEILPIPGTSGPGADQLRAEIAQAISDHFTPKPETKRRKGE